MKTWVLMLGVGALLAAPTSTFAQATDNAPPIVDVIRWTVTRDGIDTLVYDVSSSDPNLNTLAAISNFLHMEADVVAAELVITDVDWEPADPNDPNAELDGEDVYLRFIASPDFSFAPPEPTPIRRSDPNFFGRTPDEGFQPTVDATPPFTDYTLLFEIPQFLGRNQLRLQGDIDFDVRWILGLAASNEQEPETDPTLGDGFSDEFVQVCPLSLIVTCTVIPIKAIENPNLAEGNPPPFADAGPSQLVAVGTTVTLDASRSIDGTNIGFEPDEATGLLDKDELTYTWQWDSGPVVVEPVQDAPDDPTATVTLNTVGVYTFRVFVQDNVNALPSQSTVRVEVVQSIPPNRPPTASITGPGSTIVVGTIITLDGRGSTDPDADTLTYRWTQVNALGEPLSVEETVGSFQPLSGTSSPILTWQTTQAGQFFIRLLVSDGEFTATAVFPLTVVESQTAGIVAMLNSAKNLDQADDVDEQADPVNSGGAGLCGAGLFPLTLVPLALWAMRRRSTL